MKKNAAHALLAFLSLALLFYVVVIHLRFVFLPVFFLALGFFTCLWGGRKALALFLFLLPLVNSTPDIFFNGYPFNYMGVSLFFLSGILIAALVKKEKLELDFPGYRLYLLFLALLGISVLFVFLRWSNLTLSSMAFLRDTPVASSGERLSFACIFPVVTLALFSLTPFLVFLIRRWRFQENEVFAPLRAGFCLSFLLALVQKWLDPGFLAQSWWAVKMNQVNGGFSDFNAFGLFAGVLFLHQTLLLIKKLPRPGGEPPHDTPANPDGDLRRSGCRALGPGIIFLLITLAAVFISGCRTAFLFVLLAIVALVFSRKTASWTKVLFVGLLVVTFLVAGGTLKKRLEKMVSQAALLSNSSDLFQVVDQVSNVRLSMFRDSARMLARFPVTGVGAGNFLFYLKTLHFNERYYEDLPLNQYLLVFSETGAVGGLAFIFFLAALLRGLHPGPGRRVIAAIAIAIFFNNFFWFPECLLLFWTFLAGSDFRRTAGRKPSPAWPWMVVAVFAAFHALEFRALHPQTLTGQKGIAYDYGFWPPEKNDRGVFSWTGAAAGKYFPAANEGDFALSCAAPQGWLQKEKMNVTLFWRGKLFQRVVFTEDRFMRFQLPRRQEGFLEIRVHPTFNVKAIRLGADPRQLGVQFMEMKKPLP